MSKRRLYAHQEIALRWCKGQAHPALFLEMRLGKTLVAIRLMRERYPGRRRVLVLAPKTVLPFWRSELEADGLPCTVLAGGNSADRYLEAKKATGWVLTNYELARIRPALCSLPWNGVILDESTRIKNARAKLTRIICQKFGCVGTRMILSGMPAPEGPEDYVTQFLFLDTTFMGHRNFWSWRVRHMQPGRWGFVLKAKTIPKLVEYVGKRSFILRRADIHVDMKVRERRVVSLNQQQAHFMRQVKREWRMRDASTIWTPVTLVWLARIAGGFVGQGDDIEWIGSHKMRELLYLLTGELAGQHVVVWCRFNAEIKEIVRALEKARVPAWSLTGKLPISEREETIRRWRQGVYGVLVCQLAVGRFGLSFGAADTAIYYSHPTSGEERAQSEDRIVSLQKERPLLYVDLVVAGSIDEEIVRLTDEKKLSARGLLSAARMRWGT